MPTVQLNTTFELSRAIKLSKRLPDVFLTYGTQREINYKISEVAFNGGISNRKVAGLNNKPTTWKLSWKGLTSSQERELREFFYSLRGVDYLVWTPFNESEELQFVARAYENDLTSYQNYAASVELIQVFDHE